MLDEEEEEQMQEENLDIDTKMEKLKEINECIENQEKLNLKKQKTAFEQEQMKKDAQNLKTEIANLLKRQALERSKRSQIRSMI